MRFLTFKQSTFSAILLEFVLFLFLGSIAPNSFSAVSGVSESSTLKRSPFGLSYFVFFDGPGLSPKMRDQPPNVLGLPDDDGLRLTNYFSLKYKFTSNWAIDFQTRVQWVLNNPNNNADYVPFRWQSPRIGVSGKILSGENWNLTGAINTDFPYLLPDPLGGGFVASRRTTLFTPGLFAKFSYLPKNSRWSLFSLVMPRMAFYANREVAEAQLSRAGYSPELKPEFTLSLSPSINYQLTEKQGLRFGTEITYRKLILSSWNPFVGSLNGSDIKSTAWRLAAVPAQFGWTYEESDLFNLSVFFQAYPLAAQRFRKDSSQASLLDTASIGMWISGNIL